MYVSQSLADIDSKWSEVLGEFKESKSKLLWSSSDPGRRVYANKTHIYKFVLREYESTSGLRAQDLEGEFRILTLCEGIKGIPEVVDFIDHKDYECVVLKRIDGSCIEKIGLFRLLVVTSKLSKILLELSARGISHNDIKFENILLSESGKVALIDFDQATHVSFVTGIVRSFLGVELGGAKVHGSLMTIMKSYLKGILPSSVIRGVRKIKGTDVDDKLPALSKGASFESELMLSAWKIAQTSDASSPGVKVAYYSLNFDGYRFPGERSWEDRWAVLQTISDYSDKRILELGCNMSLLSSFLLLEKKASYAMGVDIDEDILESAKLVSSALGVKPEYMQQDFDSPSDWETDLKKAKPDLVFALNVLNWVEDKDRLMRFLGSFKEVIFEGHDSAEIETSRFREMGFNEIELIGKSERQRPILHCSK